ncbi:S9 family peptidase [Nocardioides sp. zg-DK7169]|uniref:alpha/beta hydrolase family protein n=1 Tax=Nocardioides sp. zg-DK7169 TaxID=2736600 RepID=UPI001557F221|nr:prolyl oligopeptidase family serine peptidase [Nocardioides sp. zg-DK7169]NPC96925.1 prolyl oligopeptidase family serine peptidase [Nocardioides sp. zg-DK7169]
MHPAQRVDYGPHSDQYAELSLPAGEPRGTVAIVHGGFWKPRYDCALGRPLADDLAARGWAAWNVEYRRGVGAAATCADVAAALAALGGHAAAHGLPLRPVVGLGHSAGGHLATWAAAQPGSPLTHVVAQAGVLDLGAAHRAHLGDGAVEAFLGHPPGPADAAYDPTAQLPLAVPVRCVHGRADDVVPLTQSERYVARAGAAGGDARLVVVEGGHMDLVDPASPAWARTLAVLDGLA